MIDRKISMLLWMQSCLLFNIVLCMMQWSLSFFRERLRCLSIVTEDTIM